MVTALDPRSLLSSATLYRWSQAVVGGRHARRLFVERFVRPEPGLKVLDIGCGPGDILDFMPDVDYVGVDLDANYVSAATRRHGHRGTFLQGSVAGFEIPGAGSFDLVLAAGLLHHLDDTDAGHLFRLARRALVPGGRLLTLDGCFEPGQGRIARFMLEADRGRHVRTRQAYEALACEVFPSVDSSIEERFFHVPYTLLVMNCSAPDGPDRL